MVRLYLKNTLDSSPFQPSNLNMTIYICFFFSIILYYEPKKKLLKEWTKYI